MSALLLLSACLALGVLVARQAQPPDGIVPGINWWVLNVALPALVLRLIPCVHFDRQSWFPVAAIWLSFLGANHADRGCIRCPGSRTTIANNRKRPLERRSHA